jgi:hypothetical protein
MLEFLKKKKKDGDAEESSKKSEEKKDKKKNTDPQKDYFCCFSHPDSHRRLFFSGLSPVFCPQGSRIPESSVSKNGIKACQPSGRNDPVLF